MTPDYFSANRNNREALYDRLLGFSMFISRTFPSFIVTVLSLFLSSCASVGPKYSEMKPIIRSIPTGVARVYFLREFNTLFIARSAPIKIDDKKVGNLSNSGFLFFDLPPGKHRISTKTWDAGQFSIEITTEEGQEYYIEVVPRVDFYIKGLPATFLRPDIALLSYQVIKNKGMFALLPVDEATAAQKLPELRYNHTSQEMAR